MHLSIGKTIAVLVVLLISIAVITTTTGLYLIDDDYRAFDNRHNSDARHTVRNAAVAIHNQVQFYQGILQLIATNPEVVNLIEFGDEPEIADWSRAVGRLLPGSLGTALAGPDGVVFGNPIALRVGAACQKDMHTFIRGGAIEYPLLHTDVGGLEHFDLLAKVKSSSGEQAGTLFVSFRLDILKDLLSNMARNGDRFSLLGRDGRAKLIVGEIDTGVEPQDYRIDVPDTSWELVLTRPMPVSHSPIMKRVMIDLIVICVFGVLITLLVSHTLLRLRKDMHHIHGGLQAMLAGNDNPPDTPATLPETGPLLQNMEQLALKLRRQHQELHQQSLSDPLTGVFNRRYFDLMLAHHHEQSRRQQPAILVIIDLNDFKDINEEFGHAGGDEVLEQTAHFLSSRARSTDIVARLGGDEFALILNPISSQDLNDRLDKLVQEHDEQIGEKSRNAAIHCHFSMGAAIIDAERYPTHSEVFRAAESALSSAKQRRTPRQSRFAIARSDNVRPIGAARETR